MTERFRRRTVCAALLGAAAGAGLAGQPAAAGLAGRAAGLVPAGSQGDAWWQRYKARLDAAGLEMEYLIRGELGNEEIMLSGLRRGRIGIVGVSDWAAASVVPEVGVIGLPYLFDSDDEFNFVLDTHLWQPLSDLFAAQDLVMVQWLNMGFINIYTQRPVTAPDDLIGMKLRATLAPGTDRFLRALGADPIRLGVADVTPALQTGLIQGGMANAVMHWALTADHAPHYTLTRHAYNLTGIFASASWLDRASPDERAAVLAGLDDIATIRAENLAEREQVLAAMERDRNITVHRLTDAQLALWRERTQGLHAQVIAELGGAAADIYAAIQDGKRAYAAEAGAQSGAADRAIAP